MKTSDIRKMAQAYVQVLEGNQPRFEVPEGLDKEGVAHFMGKAAAAHKAGKKSFEMGGKTYPVTLKKDHPIHKKMGEEVEKVQEAEDKWHRAHPDEPDMEYQVTPTHVHFDNSGYEQSFSHKEIHKMDNGGSVRGFTRDEDSDLADEHTHVYSSDEETHAMKAKHKIHPDAAAKKKTVKNEGVDGAKMKPCSHCEGSMENHDPDCPMMKKEGWDDMMKMVKDRQKGSPEKSPFDKKKVSTGTVYQRKSNKDGSSKVRESTEWTVFRRILEKRDAHTKGATAPEPIDSKASGSEKEFVAKHGGLGGNDSGIDGAKAAADTAKAATAGVRVAPKRPGDNSAGDKAMPTVSKIQGQ